MLPEPELEPELLPLPALVPELLPLPELLPPPELAPLLEPEPELPPALELVDDLLDPQPTAKKMAAGTMKRNVDGESFKQKPFWRGPAKERQKVYARRISLQKKHAERDAAQPMRVCDCSRMNCAT